MSQFYAPTPEQRLALEQLAEQVADVQRTLVADDSRRACAGRPPPAPRVARAPDVALESEHRTATSLASVRGEARVSSGMRTNASRIMHGAAAEVAGVAGTSRG